jgi:hypothetical protein
MKKLLIQFLALGSVAAITFTSCKKSDAIITSNGGTAGTLTASSTTPVLDKTKIADTTAIIKLSFTAPQYNFAAAVTNTLQIDAAGDNWAKPISVTMGYQVYSQSYSTSNFNALVLKLVPPGTTAKINVRVQHALSATVSIYSNVVSLTVTPFNLTSWIYVPGAYQGWTPATADSLESVTGNGVYTGIINFPGTAASDLQFKITPVKTWDNSYGLDASGNFKLNPTTQYAPTGGNLIAPGTGQYIITVDLNASTISFAAADFYTIIGSAPPGTAWTTDTPMKYVNDGTGTWVAKNIAMIVGEYKFRQDGQWTNSWGPSATAGMVTSSGATGDGNIQLTTAGNYNFSLVMPATTLGTMPLVTTTYTAVKQ